MSLDLGRYAHLAATGPFAYPDEPSFAGISRGRTSALMASLLDPRVVLCFENTGMEHPKTLDFLLRLEDALRRPVIWLEWRPPPRTGDPPKLFGHEVVTYGTATRGPALFDGLLRALADYRATKALGPIAPFGNMRICTAYLKHRVQQSYQKSLGVSLQDSCTEYVGLRADEPDRVSRLSSRETQSRSYQMPLAAANVTKADVNAFWSRQTFDLEIPHDRFGNCTVCFLKDYADQSRMLGESESDAAWWIDVQRRYPDFGGRGHPGYAQLLLERPTRLAVEAALRAGREPEDDGRLTPKRFRLVVQNERRYMAGEKAAFSCACEASFSSEDAA